MLLFKMQVIYLCSSRNQDTVQGVQGPVHLLSVPGIHDRVNLSS